MLPAEPKPEAPSSQAAVEAWRRQHPKKTRYGVKEPTILRDRRCHERCLLPSVPDYAALSNPLPPPPSNKRWEKQADGSWVLRDVVRPKEPVTVEEQAEPLPDFIEHVVLPTDTAMGICLKYRIKLDVLRRHNSFFGDKIQCCPVLQIPTSNLPTGFRQETTLATKLQILRNKARLAENEAKYYLDLHDGDLEKAVEEAMSDLKWEQEQDAALQQCKAGGAPAKEKERKEGPAGKLNPMVASYASSSVDALQQPLLEIDVEEADENQPLIQI